MASAQEVDLPITVLAYGFVHELDAGAPKVHTPDANGLISATASAVLIAHGTVVKGFSLVDDTATAIDSLLDDHHIGSILLRVAQNGSSEGNPVEVVHESLDVSAENRIYIPGGGSGFIVGNHYQLFRAWVDLGSGMVRRWHLSNWTPDAATSTITVGNATHWAGSAPTTIQAAIDRLAAQVYALGGNTAIP